MEPSRFSRDGLLPPSRPLPPNGTPRIKVRDRGFRDITWTLGSSLQLGYVVPTILACRPHPPVWSPPSHFPGMPVIEPVFGSFLPGHQTFRAFTAVLSRIAAFSFRREIRYALTPVLPYRHWPS